MSVDTGSLDMALFEVAREVRRSTAINGTFINLHEAYAVILEELDEVWDEIKKKVCERDPELIRKELVQVAAMAVRTIVDVVDS